MMKPTTLGPMLSVALVLLLAVPLLAVSLPETLQVGGQRLMLAGQGTRTELVFVELYSVALYLPHNMSKPRAIEGASVPKALRVQIRYDGSLPDRIPAGWRSELMPALTQQQQQQLLQQYQKLQQGDVITISYAPETGTTVAVNGGQILQDESDQVMNAFLDVWIGQTPVSEDLKQALL
jgi:hypothetical protein